MILHSIPSSCAPPVIVTESMLRLAESHLPSFSKLGTYKLWNLCCTLKSMSQERAGHAGYRPPLRTPPLARSMYTDVLKGIHATDWLQVFLIISNTVNTGAELVNGKKSISGSSWSCPPSSCYWVTRWRHPCVAGYVDASWSKARGQKTPSAVI